MANAAKKKAKLQEQLRLLEDNLKTALQKKASSAAEIDVPGKMRKMDELRKQIAAL